MFAEVFGDDACHNRNEDQKQYCRQEDRQHLIDFGAGSVNDLRMHDQRQLQCSVDFNDGTGNQLDDIQIIKINKRRQKQRNKAAHDRNDGHKDRILKRTVLHAEQDGKDKEKTAAKTKRRRGGYGRDDETYPD